jgi:mRNA interferase YafQ
MHRLKEAMLLLIANDSPLGPEWLDHPLKGEWSGNRECHIGGDFLLIYAVDDEAGKGGTIVFVRAGTHAELFQE